MIKDTPILGSILFTGLKQGITYLYSSIGAELFRHKLLFTGRTCNLSEHTQRTPYTCSCLVPWNGIFRAVGLHVGKSLYNCGMLLLSAMPLLIESWPEFPIRISVFLQYQMP
jgi:hypothetical protein